MLIRDTNGFVVVQGGDGGDSAHFTGLSVLFSDDPCPMIQMFEIEKGMACRHPSQYPWNNPWNLTRDQLMPIACALGHLGHTDNARRIFFSRLKHGFLAQSWERDCRGTTKFPWPHYEHRCKNNPEKKKPAFQGWPQWLVKYARPVLFAAKIVKRETGGKWVLFNFADPLWPHHICALAASAKVLPKPLLRLLGLPTFCLEALTFRWGDNDDQGAMLATARALDIVSVYRKIVPDWDKRLTKYTSTGRGLEKWGEWIEPGIRAAK
jgi:hypothetical protein